MRAEAATPLEGTPCLLCLDEVAAPYLSSRVQLTPGSREVFRFVRCRRCSLVYLDPRPSEAAIDRFYPPDYLPHRGPEAWGRWAPLVRSSERRLDAERLRWVLGYERLGPGTPVLDVGCGRPTFLHALHSRTGAPCVGLDPTDAGWREDPARWKGLRLVRGVLPEAEGALRRATEEAGPPSAPQGAGMQEPPGTAGDARRTDRQGPGRRHTRTPGARNGYQVITLWHALEHDYRPLETLRVLRRLAAPGALLIIEVPNLASLTARLHGNDWAGLHTPRHTAAYTPETLERITVAGGWTVTHRLRHGTLDPYILWWIGRRIRKDDSLGGSMEGRFPGFVAGKVALLPLTLLQRWIPLGVQTIVARLEG